MKNKDPFFKSLLAILPVWIYSLDLLEALKFAGVTAFFYGLTVFVMSFLIRLHGKRIFEVVLILWTLLCVGVSAFFLETSPLVFLSLWILLPLETNPKREASGPFLQFETLSLNSASFQALLFLALFVYLALMRILLVEKLALVFFNHPVGFLILFFLMAWLYQALVFGDEEAEEST